MVICKMECKKDGKTYTVDCCKTGTLTTADAYAESKFTKIIRVEASMPTEVYLSVDNLAFTAPLEEIKIYDDTGVITTIKNVYACNAETIMSASNEGVLYLTIKGKDYTIERLANKVETPKQTESSPSLKTKKRGEDGEKVFTICCTTNKRITRMEFWADKAPLPLIETKYRDATNELEVTLFANEYNYCSIRKNFSKGFLERIILKGENQTYTLENIHMVDTKRCNEGRAADDLYKVYISGERVKTEDNLILSVDEKEFQTLTIDKNKALNASITVDNTNKKEKKTMNISNIFGTSNLGKVDIESIKYSIKGIAFRTESSSYCVYDVDTLTATDVSNFVFDTPVFILPVAASDVHRGDIIYYNEMPYIVRAVKENCIAVINPFEGKLENLVPKTSILGFSFYSKVICPFDPAGSNSTATMNNLLPLLLMEDSSKADSTNILMMMSMMNGGKSDFNSLLPLMLMSDKSDKSDMLMLMMIMNNNDSFTTAADKVNPPSSIPTPPLNYSEI